VIWGDTKVLTPEGWQEARLLKAGGSVFSWNGRHWRANPILHVRKGQARLLLSMMSLDGLAPTVIHCTTDQEICRKGRNYSRAGEINAGRSVTVSEGAHVFRAEVTIVEALETDAPEQTFGFDLKKSPRNCLAGGFLVRA